MLRVQKSRYPTGTCYREDILSQSKTERYRGRAAKNLPKGSTPQKKERPARSESRRQRGRTTATTTNGDIVKKRSASGQARPSNTTKFDDKRVEQLRQSAVELIGNTKLDMMVARGSVKDFLAWDGVPEMLQNVFGKKCQLNGLAKAILAAQKEFVRLRDQERRDAQARYRGKGRKPEYVMRPGRQAAA